MFPSVEWGAYHTSLQHRSIRLRLSSATVVCYCHLLLSFVAVVCYQCLFEERVESGFLRVRLHTYTQTCNPILHPHIQGRARGELQKRAFLYQPRNDFFFPSYTVQFPVTADSLRDNAPAA